MPLKFKFKSKDEIPAEHLSFYVERDGAFLLDVEGATDKARVDEFRNHNLALKRQLDELTHKYEGIDPDNVKSLLEEKRRLEEAKHLKEGEVDKLVESRTRTLKSDLEKQISNLASEHDALNARLVEIEINQGVTVAGSKHGLRPSAIPDALARGRRVFQLVNGVPTAFKTDGKTVRYGRDGVTPLTLDEWADGLVSEAPHLFESNAGGGAVGHSSGGAGSVRKNPFKRGPEWNLTEQMRLQKIDPNLAARLKAAA